MACEGTYPVWQVTVDVTFHPLSLPVEYKYVVCSARGGQPEHVEAIKWETDICNRIAYLPLARAQVTAPSIATAAAAMMVVLLLMNVTCTAVVCAALRCFV
jgi:hypothetical protein